MSVYSRLSAESDADSSKRGSPSQRALQGYPQPWCVCILAFPQYPQIWDFLAAVAPGPEKARSV